MTELLALDLVEKGLVTNQIVLEVGYDVDNLKNQAISSLYNGEITTDKYGIAQLHIPLQDENKQKLFSILKIPNREHTMLF